MWTIQNWLGRNTTWTQCEKYSWKTFTWERTDIIPWPFFFGLHITRMRNEQRYCGQLQKCLNPGFLQKQKKNYFVEWNLAQTSSHGRSRISAGTKEKLPCLVKLGANIFSWSMEGHAKKCSERHYELANKTPQSLYKVTTPCLDDHQIKKKNWHLLENLQKICSFTVRKCLYFGTFYDRKSQRARALFKWIKTRDERLIRLISSIHHTSELKQFCHVGNTAQQCRLNFFRTLTLPEILTQNRPRMESCAYLEVTRLFPQIGCAKDKFLFHTVRLNLRLSLLMQVYE